MNTKLIVGAVVVVAVAGGAWFALGRGGDAGPEALKDGAEKGSLQSLLAAGKPQKCAFSSEVAGVKNEGTVYTAGGKMRGDFVASLESGTTSGHMIVADGKTWFWQEGQSEGITMSTEGVTEAAGSAAGYAKAIDLSADVDYDCDGWSTDASSFSPPKNVHFTDMSAMMKQVKQAIPSGAMPAACAACDQLSGAQKTQCRAALQCN